MSKWAFLTALGRLAPGVATPRTHGADGRALVRPWRVPSANAVATARAVRAGRPQPAWPRLVGLCCIGIAVCAATAPVAPLPSQAQASTSTRYRGNLQPPAAIQPRGVVAGVPAVFAWSRVAGTRAPARVTLLDEGYRELALADGIDAAQMVTPPQFAAALVRGGTFHWTVTLGDGARAVASRLQTFTIR